MGLGLNLEILVCVVIHYAIEVSLISKSRWVEFFVYKDIYLNFVNW